MTGLIVDLFAGGGGASTGIEQALGRSPDIAINHDPAAIAMHQANHPHTRHYCESVFDVSPAAATAGRSVDLLWASPDCTHFSRAKGGKPVDKTIRGLAWVVVSWAAAVAPRVITLENVPEFVTWGPLDGAGRPIKSRAGETFREFVGQLRALGYSVEHRVIVCADTGAATTRERLFLVARRDGCPITWPAATHGANCPQPWATVGECIDWSIPCPSIFLTMAQAKAAGFPRIRRPLAGNTEARIARGLGRYVLSNPRPYLVTLRGTAATHLHGDAIDAPLRTISAGGQHHSLVLPWIAKHYSGVIGHDTLRPLGTVTGRDHHAVCTAALSRDGSAAGARRVAAFVIKYYGQGGQWQGCDEPLHTIVSKARFGLVEVVLDGEPWAVVDIGHRMFTPRELARAQGFPDGYILTGTQEQQIARIGNSVPPPTAAALVAANCAQPAAARATA